MVGIQEELFDPEHVYYQWLTRRSRAAKTSAVLDYLYGLAILALCALIFGVWLTVVAGDSFVLIGAILAYFVLLLFVEAVVVLAALQRYVQKDFSTGFMQDIFTTDVTTSELSRDFKKWIIESLAARPRGQIRNIMLAVVVFIGLLAGPPIGWEFPVYILVLAAPWATWRFLLGAGLIGAAVPKWNVAGPILLICAVVIPMLVFCSEIQLVKLTLSPAASASRVTLYTNFSIAIFVAYYAIAEAQIAIAPKLLNLRRQGVWE